MQCTFIRLLDTPERHRLYCSDGNTSINGLASSGLTVGPWVPISWTFAVTLQNAEVLSQSKTLAYNLRLQRLSGTVVRTQGWQDSTLQRKGMQQYKTTFFIYFYGGRQMGVRPSA